MDTAWRNKTLGVVGGGNMAEALVRGLLAANLTPPANIAVFDPLPARRDLFAALGCQAVPDPRDLLAADILLLAVKPQKFREAVRALDPGPARKTLIISIAAGVPVAAIEKLLPVGAKVIRVMPNTPLLVGLGVSALAKGSHAGAEDLELARLLFACAGQAHQVEEASLDAVTALSGSGPAYLFRFAEALIQAGQKLGLDPELAKNLAVGTLRGAAEMLAANPEPARLREQVTSPGGTTAAALAVFDKRGLCDLVAEALAAARNRSAEMGREA